MRAMRWLLYASGLLILITFLLSQGRAGAFCMAANNLLSHCNQKNIANPRCALIHYDIGFVSELMIFDGSQYSCFYALTTGFWPIDRRPAWGGHSCSPLSYTFGSGQKR